VLAAWGGDLLPLITALAGAGDLEPARAEFLGQALDVAGARKRPGEVAGAILLLTRDGEKGAAGDRRHEALASLFRALGSGGLARVLDGAPAETAAEIRRRLEALFARVAARAQDDSAPLADRVAAANLLGAGAGAGVVALLAGLIDARYPADLQLAAARGLGRVPGPEATAALLAAFARGTPRVRGEVLDALIRDTARARPLIDALERGEVQAVDFDLNRRKSFLESLSDENRKRAEPLLAGLAADPDRAAVVEKYRQALASTELAGTGDAAHGKDLFLKKCALCHRAGDQGTAVGADLSGMRVREVDALLADILDPSRAVAPEFLSYVLITRDGQALSGLLALETPANVVIRGAEGKTETVLRRDIETLRATAKSFMPDGFEKEFAPSDLRDVIAFIKAGLAEPR
jgi:putative heme-binding domain-containing protein